MAVPFERRSVTTVTYAFLIFRFAPACPMLVVCLI